MQHVVPQTLVTLSVVAIFAVPANATPPGQYRFLLNSEMLSSSSPGGDFLPLVDEQKELGDPPSGVPNTNWKSDWRYAQEFPVSATIDLGKVLPLAVLWIYDTNGKGDIQIEAAQEIQVDEQGAWQVVSTYDCGAYQRWVSIPLDQRARYLRLTFMTPAPGVAEIAVDVHSEKSFADLLARRAEARRLEQQRQAELRQARQEALQRPVIEMEPYGRLSLVDEIDCTAADPAHGFVENPSGCSQVKPVLGRPCRVLPTLEGESSTIKFTLGRTKLLRSGGVYVLAVEYPEDGPRSMVVVNNGNEVSRGFYTGQSLGDALHSKYVESLPESLDVPLSGRYETWSMLVRLHDRFGTNGLIRGHDRPRDQSPEGGFDVTIGQWSKKNAPLSLGIAVSKIRLYEVVDVDRLAAPLAQLPPELPRRHIFWREEMSDGVVGGKRAEDRGLDNYLDWYRHKAELMRFLGIRTYCKDLLEFGANQGWDSSPHGGNDWVYFNSDTAHYWSEIVELMGDYGFDILPYYEYSGSKGKQGLGSQRRCKPLTRDDAYTHIGWIENANADITDPDTYDDFRKMLDVTVVRLSDKARFVGAWLRSRSQMPVSFGKGALERFADEVNHGRPVTRKILQADESLYRSYLDWWHLKRRDFLLAMRDYLRQHGVEDAVVLFTGESSEPGVGFADWTPRFVAESPDLWSTILSRPEHQIRDTSRKLLTVDEIERNELYLKGLLSPGLDWGGWEVRHSSPADDPQNFQSLEGAMLTHAFNRLYTVASPKTFELYRTCSGLTIVRHYCLNENMMFDANDESKLGYFVTDMERSGPFCMMAEAVAFANGDPTMIGYLTSNSFSVGFPTYVRNFNVNFLALPALPSRRVPQASDDPAIVVREIETPDHGTWYAAVNVSMSAVPQTAIHLVDNKPIRSAVNGEIVATDGTVETAFYPFELKAWHVD
jgi:hypothetical protein